MLCLNNVFVYGFCKVHNFHKHPVLLLCVGATIFFLLLFGGGETYNWDITVFDEKVRVSS